MNNTNNTNTNTNNIKGSRFSRSYYSPKDFGMGIAANRYHSLIKIKEDQYEFVFKQEGKLQVINNLISYYEISGNSKKLNLLCWRKLCCDNNINAASNKIRRIRKLANSIITNSNSGFSLLP